tara:strand:- start:344 stop:589 length:246 start_codon:yes stop_codon:yes gene_type:complete
MGPLALLGLLGGGAGLASIMKQKGIDLKKKKKDIAKDVLKKKKKYKPEWQTKPDTKKIKEQQERSKKNKKRFMEKLEELMS